MDQSQHTFVKKPFYKWFHRCTECDKRKVWIPMVKCSGCKTYYHRRCIRLDDDVCRRSTTTSVPTTDRNQQAAVTLPDEDGRRDQKTEIRPDGGDVRDLNPAEGDVVKDCAYNNIDVPQVQDNLELAEQRSWPLAADSGDLGAASQLQGQTPEVIEEDSVSDISESVKRLVYEMVAKSVSVSTKRSDECSAAPANEDAQADEPKLSSSIPPARHISDSCLMNFEFPRSCWPTRTLLIQAEPIRGCAPYQLPPYRLPGAGTETVERQKDNGVGVEVEKCIDVGDQMNDVPGENKLE